MSRFWLLVLLLFLPAEARASLKEARLAWLRGDYAEAREFYVEAAKAPKDRAAAAIGVSRTWQSVGEYDKALQAIADGLKALPKDADLLGRQAELLLLRGRWDEAEAAARAAVKIRDDAFAARWVLGQLLRDQGKRDEADEEFLWFIRTYTRRSNEDQDITDPQELLYVGLAGLERARLHHQTDQYQFILKEVFGEATRLDKAFWPAEFEAAQLFLEKHNKPAANRALDRVLIANPRAADALVAKGILALIGYEMKDAENYADQALQINPNLVSALCLRSDVFWFASDLDTATKELAKARKINPRDEQVLARLAAVAFAQKNAAEFDALEKQVRAQNPKPLVFYTELASQLDHRKLYLQAEKYYQLAVGLETRLPDALTGLGMLWMRLAKEPQARKLLEQAFDADEFNVRVANTLKVLDHLDKYQTIKTKHFVLRYDAKNDEVLARYLEKYLEEVYDELAAKFDYHPAGPFHIQVFNKHEMFSGRITALPDLHTIGACTGPLVAMVSTHDKSKVISKPFNWVRVIRHELVHVFNLDQTAYQVPHWFTEGLAVTLEGSTTPPTWHVMLAEKVAQNDLLNLDNILMGFVRPRSPEQWQQAYYQSQLYVRYLTQTQGEKAIGRLLAAFAEGLETGPALAKACKISKDDFEKGYREFLDTVVKESGVRPRPAGKQLTLKALKDANAKDPNDMDIAAKLAERYLQIGKKKEAAALADEVLRKDARHSGAVTVKALFLLGNNDAEGALLLLNNAVTDATSDPRPLKLLGKLQFESKQFDLAARTLERGRKAEPHDPFWIAQLAKVYLKTENQAKLIEIFHDLVQLDYDDPQPRKRLARHYQEQKDHAKAEQYARMALEIDLRDAEVQRILLDALDSQGKNAQAKEFRRIFGS